MNVDREIQKWSRDYQVGIDVLFPLIKLLVVIFLIFIPELVKASRSIILLLLLHHCHPDLSHLVNPLLPTINIFWQWESRVKYISSISFFTL
jgi:hypothetical protein